MTDTEKIIAWVAKQKDLDQAFADIALGRPGIWLEILGRRPTAEEWNEYHKIAAKAMQEAENESKTR